MVKRMFLILAVVALMAAMMVSGPAAMAKPSNPGKHKGNTKVTLCLNGHTINIALPAKAKFLKAHPIATLGACT